MTLQEILRSKGLSDEDIESTIGEMKQNKIFTASEENLDIRYKDLQGKFEGKNKEHQEATALIEQLKKDNAGNEALQGKIQQYENQIAELTKQINDQKIETAMDRALTAAGANSDDLDYLKFLWKQKGDVSLDDDEKIKGGDDVIAALKTQRPAQFATAQAQLQVEPQKLPEQNNNLVKSMTKEEFNKLGYDSRVKLKETDPELYAQMKG